MERRTFVDDDAEEMRRQFLRATLIAMIGIVVTLAWLGVEALGRLVFKTRRSS